MTSGELLNKRFDKARMGGYKTTEVEAFLAEAATAFTQLTRENSELKRQVADLQARTAKVEEDKDSLRDALLSAQKFADSLVNDAKGQAETILAEARGRADNLVNGVQGKIVHEKEELTRVKTEVASFRSNLLDLYRAHLELIGAMPVETEPEGEKEEKQPAVITPGNADKADAPEAPAKAEETAKQSAAKKGAEGDAVREEPPIVPFHLNMRYDEQTGEYVPLSPDDMEE